MNVHFVSTNDWVPWGGSEVLWSACALYMRKNYEDIKISAWVKQWPTVPVHIESLAQVGIEIRYKKAKPLPYAKRLLNRGLPTSMRFSTRPYYYQMTEERPDLIVFSLGDHNEAYDLIQWVRRAGIKYALVIQLAKEAQIATDDYYQAIKDNYKQARKVFFVSRQNQEILELQLASRLNNAEVISNPLPFGKRISVEYPSCADIFSIAFVASLSTNHKGHDLLFQVLSLEKWKARNLHVNLYGDGPHRKYLMDLKRFLGLEKVHFNGFISSQQDIWSNNNAAILCSRMEGQSLALLEALSFNRMAIATDVGDAKDLLIDGENGFIADAPTVKHIDEAMERAWQKRDEWEKMGRNAGERCRSIKTKDPVIDFAVRLRDILLID